MKVCDCADVDWEGRGGLSLPLILTPVSGDSCTGEERQRGRGFAEVSDTFNYKHAALRRFWKGVSGDRR